MSKSPNPSILKLRKLKEIRRKNLEKNFLQIQMKGQDHYVFIKEMVKLKLSILKVVGFQNILEPQYLNTIMK